MNSDFYSTPNLNDLTTLSVKIQYFSKQLWAGCGFRVRTGWRLGADFFFNDLRHVFLVR